MTLAQSNTKPYSPHHCQVVIKLCAEGASWQREKTVYSNRMTLDPATAADYMPAVVEILPGVQHTDTGEPIPPGVVMEAGVFTLEVNPRSF